MIYGMYEIAKNNNNLDSNSKSEFLGVALENLHLNLMHTPDRELCTRLSAPPPPANHSTIPHAFVFVF